MYYEDIGCNYYPADKPIENPMTIDSLWNRGYCYGEEELEERFRLNIEFDLSSFTPTVDDLLIDFEKDVIEFDCSIAYDDESETSGTVHLEGWLNDYDWDRLIAILYENGISYKEIEE